MAYRLALVFLLGLVLVACDGAGDVTVTVAETTTSTQRSVTSTTESGSTTTTEPSAESPADLVFTGGPVVTMDPDIGTVEAIAIEGDTIVAVGSLSDIRDHVGPDTVVVELDGRTVSPGFVDAHTHILTDMGGIETGQSLALSNGITSLADASIEPGWPERFIEADRMGVLRVRTSMYLARTDPCGIDQGFWYEDYEPDEVFADRLRVAGVKIFSDGGVCGVLAASEPFLDGVDVGPPYHDFDTLVSLIDDANDRGYQLAIHAQGDLAIAQVQDAYAVVLADGGNPLRHRIDHNVFSTLETIGRYSELDLVPILFGSSEACNADLPWTDFYKQYAERPGDILAANRGLTVAWHGDDPWLTPISPISELFSLVTRGRVAEDGTICDPPPWMADGGVTVEQGLAMMTTGSAYAIRQDDVVGSLVPGKFADLVVLSGNLLTVPLDAIPGVELLMTMIGGVTEFCAPGAEAVCPWFATSDESGQANAAASSSAQGQAPALAFDGDVDSLWSAGSHPTQWIEIDLGEPGAITGFRMLVSQSPAGRTVHVVSVDGVDVATLDGGTADREELVIVLGIPVTGQVVRVTTTLSPSWVAWYEIEIKY